MSAATKRKCTNPACAFHDIVVSTAAEKCLGCSEDLTSPYWFANDLGDLFGAGGPLFGGKR